MLAIRMQRTGRKGQAMFRVVVQNSRQTPTSGRVVAQLGNVNPHTKQATLDKEKVEFYLSHGAQPSDRAARLFKKEGIKLPDWVSLSADGDRKTRNPEKLRKNQPAKPAEEAPAAATDEVAEASVADTPVAAEAPSEAAPVADTDEKTEA